jgi:pimeloyl-ACP methyl ester carboxylesterase
MALATSTARTRVDDTLLQALPSRLTRRDRYLLRLLYEHDVLTTTHVCDVGFATRGRALKPSIDGWVDETAVIVGPWDIDVGLIRCPLWWYHGAHDVNAPISAVRRLTRWSGWSAVCGRATARHPTPTPA